MRILFIGQFETPYLSNTALRARAMEQLGHEVIRLCCVGYWQWGGRWVSGALRRLNAGPPVERFNADIQEAADELKPDVVFVEKAQHIRPSTLEAVRRRGESFLIHYTPDPALTFHRDRFFEKSLSLYDLIVTTKSYEIELYRAGGARDVLLVPPAFDEQIHRPLDPGAGDGDRFGCDVAFIGTYGPGREKWLEPMAGWPVDLAIRGNGWSERCRSSAVLGRVRGAGLSGDDYALALNRARIGLGLLSPLVPDVSTTRSVEIPACGTFLMAERTEEHQALFEEGEEAEFFDSLGELEQKLKFYLAHEEPRRRIARAGRERCLRSGYGNLPQMKRILSSTGATLV